MVIKELPHDILMEILLSLPVKSLLRFKSVCKIWCSYIQDPKFVTLHHNKAKSCDKNERVLAMRVNRKKIPPEDRISSDDEFENKLRLSILSNDTLNLLTDIDTVVPQVCTCEPIERCSTCILILSGPCNGLVCLSTYSDIVICNPATREFKVVPPAPFSYAREGEAIYQGVGFGFDPSSNDYKVVRTSCVDDCYDVDMHPWPRTEVYDLSVDSWREIDEAVEEHVYYDRLSGLCFNSTYHWLAEPGSGPFIVTFSFAQEVFQRIDFPDEFGSKALDPCISVWNGYLAVFMFNISTDRSSWDIWVMKEYGVKESWTKQFNIGPFSQFSKPLMFWKEKEIITKSYWKGRLFACDVETKTTKKLQIRGLSYSLRAISFTESLTSISSHIES